MNPKSSDANREILQNSTTEEPAQPSPVETADVEEVASGSMPENLRPLSTPRMKVQS